MNIREELRQGKLIFDGGMGTYLSSKERVPGSGCELANIDKPILVSAIHREYLSKGARAIKTNTFAANRITYKGDGELVRRLISAGYRVATKVAEPFDDHVFADIGPITGSDEQDTIEEYRFVCDQFIELGATNYLFETNSSLDGLCEVARYIQERVPDAFIIVSFAIMPGGYTREGLFGENLLREAADCHAISAVGFNCISGVRQIMDVLEEMELGDLIISVMPNSGSPVVVNNRTVYQSDPEYFGRSMAELARYGVQILGGCCGTTPAHIAALKAALEQGAEGGKVRRKREITRACREDSRFWNRMELGHRTIAVELDPPENTDIQKYMSKARVLRDAGADIITIADCPTARACMDSSLLACLTKRDAGIEVLPHLTCRDRNLNASKALMLGLSAEGVRNILVITGDPIPTAERDEVKSVYQFNSRKMTSFVKGLERKGSVDPFHVWGALNVNARNFDIQLKFAKEKVELGMSGLFTQPVLSKEAVQNLKLAREELDCRIMGGIMPVVSERNARFMNSEVNGIYVSDEILKMYQGLSREQAEDLAVELSVQIAEEITPYVDGYYVMTPFGRVELVRRILEAIQKM